MINRIVQYLKRYICLSIFVVAGICFLYTPHELCAQVTYDVSVTKMQFLYGVGRGPTHAVPDTIDEYYRGYGLPGTMIELTAQMDVGGNPAPMYGPVQFTIQYTIGAN